MHQRTLFRPWFAYVLGLGLVGNISFGQVDDMPVSPGAKPIDRKALIDDTGIKRLEEAVGAEGAGALTPATKALFAKFEKLMTGAKLQGRFTIDGRPMDQMAEETYEIEKVEKLPEGDQWVITARIKYGKHDTVVPVPLDVKWAGSTPVLTLDSLTIPGMGTFGARVVLHKDKYAGTWSHDDVGGHMFGKIVFSESEESSKDAPTPK